MKFLICLSLFVFPVLSFSGCAGREPQKVELNRYRTGKCWIWQTAEKEFYNHKLSKCNARTKNPTAWCMRKKGHWFSHHFHGSGDCYLVFR